MAIVKYEYEEVKALRKAKKREKKKRPRMKLSGTSVKTLQKLINKSGK